MSISKVLIVLDRICDFVPFLSTLTNGIDMLITRIVFRDGKDSSNSYFNYLKGKNEHVGVLALLPIVPFILRPSQNATVANTDQIATNIIQQSSDEETVHDSLDEAPILENLHVEEQSLEFEYDKMTVDDVLNFISEGKKDVLLEHWNDIHLSNEDRLEILTKIFQEGWGGLLSYGKLFINRLFTDINPEERLRMCSEIASLGLEQAKLIILFIGYSEWEDVQPHTYLNFFNETISKYKSSYISDIEAIKYNLIECLEKIISKFDIQQLIELSKIFNDKEKLRNQFIHIIDETKILSNRPQVKLNFYLEMWGGRPLYEEELLYQRIQKLQKKIVNYLRDSKDFTERLTRYNKIASGGQKVFEYLENDDSLIFNEVLRISNNKLTLEDRLTFYREMVSVGEWIARLVAKNIDKLRIDKASPLECLELCQAISSYSDSVKEFLVVNYNRLQLVRKEIQQLYIELWKVPPIKEKPLSFVSQVYTGNGTSFVNLLMRNRDEPLDAKLICQFRNFLSDHPNLKQITLYLDRVIDEKDKYIQSNLLDSILFITRLIYDLDETQIKIIEETHLLKHILDHKIPNNRFEFVRQLVFCVKKYPEMLHETVESFNNSWTKLASILGVALNEFSFDCVDILRHIEKKRFIMDKQFNAVIQILNEIRAFSSFTADENRLIQNKIISIFEKNPGPRKIEPIINDLNSLTNILRVFGRETFIECLISDEDPSSLFLEHFQKLFEVRDTENFARNYQETFNNFRDPKALFTYLGTINQLSNEERVKVLKALNEYVNSVLEGKFKENRYRTENNTHLRMVFAARTGIKDQWLNKSPEKIISFADEQGDSLIDYRKFLEEKVIRFGHIDLQKIPRLVDFLNGAQGVILESQDPLDQFQNVSIQLCNNQISINEYLKIVHKIGVVLGELQNDFAELQPKKVIGKYVVKETDDACDLLLIGTEVPASCQNVGSQGTNRCLMSYTINGDVKAITVKQGEKIIARSVIRLMLDEQNNTPLIFLERVYSSIPKNLAENVILEWAMEKAKEMKIPLVSKEIGQGDPYIGQAEYFGGYAPYVYSDAAGGIHEGPFKIINFHVLYQP